MDFFEAMSLMKQGSKVRIRSWPKEIFIGISECHAKIFGEKKTIYTLLSQDGVRVSSPLSLSALIEAEWECIVEFEEDDL